VQSDVDKVSFNDKRKRANTNNPEINLFAAFVSKSLFITVCYFQYDTFRRSFRASFYRNKLLAKATGRIASYNFVLKPTE